MTLPRHIQLDLTCPYCGAPALPSNRFCGSCGTAVGSQPSDRYGSPQAYTPKHLAEKIINSKTALEGERKQVTVLFADLKGSMELLANRDPEEAQRLLDPVLAHMSRRPGRVKEEIAVPFPKPRRFDIVMTPTFVSIKERVLHLIREELITANHGGSIPGRTRL